MVTRWQERDLEEKVTALTSAKMLKYPWGWGRGENDNILVVFVMFPLAIVERMY